MSDTDNKNISPEEKHAPAISQAVARYERLKSKAPPPTPQSLEEACEQGGLDAVKTFHADGADITVDDNYAVRVAAEIGHLEIVKYLHENGANITAKNNEALISAARNGHLDVVKYLHEHDAGITANKNEALISAARNGHLDVVKYLHEHDADITANKNEALISAAENGHLDVLRYLHESGADITAGDNEASLGAAENGHLDVLRYLHEHGVNVKVIDNRALDGAARRGQLDMVKYLHENGTDITAQDDAALRWAARYDRLDVVKYLHEHGANLTARDSVAVRCAAENGHLDVVKYLHEHGANITAQDNEALRWAAEKGYLDVVRYLHEHGADITVQDNEILKKSALYAFGGCHSYYELALYVIDAGTPINILTANRLESINAYRSWQKRHGDCPKRLTNRSPHYFRPKAFYPVQAVIKKEGYKEEIANKYAYNAAALFKTPDRFWRYVEKWADFSDKQPVHDVIQHIDIPQEGRFDLTAWGDACLKFGPKMARLVKFADQLSTPMKDEKGGWSYTLTRDEIAKHAYKKAHEAPELAKLCFEVTYTEKNFEKALETLNAHTNIVAKALETKMPPPNSNIPDIRIDGEAFDKPGYVLRRLESGDIKGLLLGEFTSCCQHIGGAGSKCAEHGFFSPHGGFYVVEKQETGEITGQSWVWRGKDGELVLDSFESLNGHYTAQQVTRICEEIARAVSSDHDVEKQVSDVYIGAGGATPRLAFNLAANPPEPLDYTSYRDSHQQYEIATFERGIG